MVQVVMTRCKVLGLYRRLLRLHQRLPGDLGSVGQRFVQQEFKSHRESSTEHATLFLKEWTVGEVLHKYTHTLTHTLHWH